MKLSGAFLVISLFQFFLVSTCADDFINNEFVEYKGNLVDSLGSGLQDISLELRAENSNQLVQTFSTAENGAFKIFSPRLSNAVLQFENNNYLFQVTDSLGNLEDRFRISFPTPENQISDLGTIQISEQ